jgi:hypothetical protein
MADKVDKFRTNEVIDDLMLIFANEKLKSLCLIMSSESRVTLVLVVFNLNSTNVKKKEKSRLYIEYSFYSFQGIFFIIDFV